MAANAGWQGYCIRTTGVDMGLLAALRHFIPIFGPIIAGGPAGDLRWERASREGYG
jgi:hypothetical protein